MFDESLPSATSWQGLYDSISSCVDRMESEGFTPSEPQFKMGASVYQLSFLTTINGARDLEDCACALGLTLSYFFLIALAEYRVARNNVPVC